MRHSAKDERGFSLVELLVVVGIIASLAAIASLSMDFVRKEWVSSKTKEILADLQKARVDALSIGPTEATGAIPFMRGSGIRLVSSASYVIFKFNDCNQNYAYNSDGCAGPAREEAEARTISLPLSLELKRLDAGTLVDPADVTADDIRIFDRFGMLRKNDWTTSPDFTLVVKHKSAGYAKCIIVGANQIREGLWNGSSCATQ